MRQILAGAVVVVLLVGLLVWSQHRPAIRKVSGFVEAHEIRLGSRVGGRVEAVEVEEGQEVQAGDPLLVLEPFDLDSRIQEAEANLLLRQRQRDKLLSTFRHEQEVLAARVARMEHLVNKLKESRQEQERTLQAQLTLAQAQLELARDTHERTQSLFTQQRGAVTREDVARDSSAYKVALANKDAQAHELSLFLVTRDRETAEAEAQLAEAKAQQELVTRQREAEQEEAEAAVEAADAALAALRDRVPELTVRAPLRGIVEAVELRKGDLVAANAPVLSLMDLNNLWVRAYVPQQQLQFDVGAEVEVTVDSYPGRRFQGVVSFISRQAEFTPSNVQTQEERAKQVFRIKVTLAPPDQQPEPLRPGLSADVWLP